jgi:DnaJ-class molecular chaperone
MMNKTMKRAKALAQERLAGKHQAEKCIACNGSGHYDHDASPVCSSCGGTGKQKKQS